MKKEPFAFNASSSSRAWGEAAEHRRSEAPEPVSEVRAKPVPFVLDRARCAEVIDDRTMFPPHMKGILTVWEAHFLKALIRRTSHVTRIAEPAPKGGGLVPELVELTGQNIDTVSKMLGRFGPRQLPGGGWEPVGPGHVLRRLPIPPHGRLPNSGRVLRQGGVCVELLFQDPEELAKKLELLKGPPGCAGGRAVPGVSTARGSAQPDPRAVPGGLIRRSPSLSLRGDPLKSPQISSSSSAARAERALEYPRTTKPLEDSPAANSPAPREAVPSTPRRRRERERDESHGGEKSTNETKARRVGRASEAEQADVEAVLEHWRAALRPRLPIRAGQTFTEVQIGTILGALRRHWTRVQLMAVVEGCLRNPWNMADEHRQRVETLFGTDGTIQDLAARCPRSIMTRLGGGGSGSGDPPPGVQGARGRTGGTENGTTPKLAHTEQTTKLPESTQTLLRDWGIPSPSEA
jgi:hypothetical protein